MGLKFANNSESTLAAGIGAIDTTLSVAPGHGARFPTIVSGSGDFFYATLVSVGGDREVIKVTEHQAGTDVFQVIERAADAIQNGTPTAYAFALGDVVQIRLPAIAVLSPDATKSDTFHVGSDTTGPKIKNNSGTLDIRNAADSAYANLHALGLTLGAALALAGNITGCVDLVMSGALSGVTTITASGAIAGASLAVTGAVTAGATSALPIDNESAGHKIKARDHGTASTPEVVNVVYGTGSPPSAGSVPEGTIWLKYIP